MDPLLSHLSYGSLWVLAGPAPSDPIAQSYIPVLLSGSSLSRETRRVRRTLVRFDLGLFRLPHKRCRMTLAAGRGWFKNDGGSRYTAPHRSRQRSPRMAKAPKAWERRGHQWQGVVQSLCGFTTIERKTPALDARNARVDKASEYGSVSQRRIPIICQRVAG